MIDFTKMTDAQIDRAFALNLDLKREVYELLRKRGNEDERAADTTIDDGAGAEDLPGAGVDTAGVGNEDTRPGDEDSDVGSNGDDVKEGI